MSWITLTIITIVLWGVGQVLVKKGLNSISPLWTSILATVSTVIIFLPLSLIEGIHPTSVNLFVYSLIVPILYIFYYYALEKGQLSVTGTIIALYPTVTIALSIIFLGERLSLMQVLATLLILLGLYLISKPTKNTIGIKKVWLLWALSGAVAIGAGDFFAKIFITEVGAPTYNFYYAVNSVLAVIIYWSIDNKGRILGKLNTSSLLITFAGTFMFTFGFIFFNKALESGQASLVAPISSGYVGLTVLLSMIFLKESINKLQAAAILLMIAGVILISVTH